MIILSLKKAVQEGNFMKINVALLEQDLNYQNRLVVAFREKFSEHIEIFQCNAHNVTGIIEEHDIKVLAMSQGYDVDLSAVPEQCGIVVLTDNKTDEFVGDYMALCKYQKVSDIGKQLYYIGTNYDKILAERKEKQRIEEEERKERERIAEEERLRKEEEERKERERLEKERLEREKKEEEERIAAEKARQEEERKRLLEEQKAREERIRARRSNPDLYLFIPATDGEGSSVASVAAAMVTPKDNINVLYIDFKQIGKMDRYFQTNSVGIGFDEILKQAIEEKLTPEELSNVISTDNHIGVDFIYNSECMFEVGFLGAKGFENLMDAIGKLERYDVVIANMEGTLSPMTYEAIKRSAKLYFVAAGTPESNQYLENKVKAIGKFDAYNDTKLTDNINILYNMFDRKSVKLEGLNDAGTIPVMKAKSDAALLDLMIKQPAFAQMISLPED